MPATLSSQFVRSGLLHWGGPRIYGVGRVKVGYTYLGHRFTLNPGTTTLKVYYFGNHGAFGDLFTQTRVVRFPVTLRANPRYRLEARTGTRMVQFLLVNPGRGTVVATSRPVHLWSGPAPHGKAYPSVPRSDLRPDSATPGSGYYDPTHTSH